MNRDYKTGIHSNIDFFTGIEIEKTPAYGLKTLFVVGIQPIDIVKKYVNEHNCKHVYLGANHSFDSIRLPEWDAMIVSLLDSEILTTLDVDIKYLNSIIDTQYINNDLFIAQLSIKIPNLNKFNKNTTIKIDDVDFKASNIGVWCHKLNKLTTNDYFTSWDEYTKDEPL